MNRVPLLKKIHFYNEATPYPNGWWFVALQATVCITLAARGWLTWQWDSPLRSLVWQEDWWARPLNHFFGIPWRHFAEHSEPTLTSVLEYLGMFQMLCAVVPWLVIVNRLRWTRWLLLPAGLLLVLDDIGRWIDADRELGMLIEHTLQVASPFLLLMALSSISERVWMQSVTVAASLTFIGHGLYAIGFYSVPLIFQTMTMQILDCEQDTALTFLKIAGLLDFIAVTGLWISVTRPWALIYMIGWGAATALARVWAHNGIDPWLAETLVRTSHWSLPLILLYLSTLRKTDNKSDISHTPSQ